MSSLIVMNALRRQSHQQQQQQQQRHRVAPAAARDPALAAPARAHAQPHPQAAAAPAVEDEADLPRRQQQGQQGHAAAAAAAPPPAAPLAVAAASVTEAHHQQQAAALQPPLPPPANLDDLVSRIRKGSLPDGTLCLGWRDSDFLVSSRSVAALERALKQQPYTCNAIGSHGSATGSVKKVSIGWRHTLHQRLPQRVPQQRNQHGQGSPPNSFGNSFGNNNRSRTNSTSTGSVTSSSGNNNSGRTIRIPHRHPIHSLGRSSASSSESSNSTIGATPSPPPPPPRLSNNPRQVVLSQFLMVLGRTCPHQLESVQLVLNDWLPMPVLQDFLQRQTSLRVIDFQAVTMLQSPSSSSSSLLSSLAQRRRRGPCRRRLAKHGGNNRGPLGGLIKPKKRQTAPIPPTTSSNSSNNKDKQAASTQALQHRQQQPYITSVVPILLQHQHIDRHPHLKTIKLVDCDLNNADAVQLADFIHLRGGIAELVLKCNRQFGSKAVKVLCQAPVMQLLDLSCCDLTCSQGTSMAQALAQRPWVLQELIVAGNYRLFEDDATHHDDTKDDSRSPRRAMALFEPACCEKVKSLDVSHCDLSDYVTIQILNALRRLTYESRDDTVRQQRTIRLEKVVLHGCRVGSDKGVEALCSLLSQQQQSRVNHKQHHSPMTAISRTTSTTGAGGSPLSLRVLHLDNPRSQASASAVSVAQLHKIANQVVHNYHLEELKLNHYGECYYAETTTTTTATNNNDSFIDDFETDHAENSRAVTTTTSLITALDLWKEMDFYFRLNKAGRRILLLQQPHPTSFPLQRRRRVNSASSTGSSRSVEDDGNDDTNDWYSALAMAGSDTFNNKSNHNDDDDNHSFSHNSLELLYWMVRHSADRFGHLRDAGGARR